MKILRGLFSIWQFSGDYYQYHNSQGIIIDITILRGLLPISQFPGDYYQYENSQGASKMEKERERKKQDGEIYFYPLLVHRIDINPRFQLLMQARPLALTWASAMEVLRSREFQKIGRRNMTFPIIESMMFSECLLFTHLQWFSSVGCSLIVTDN